ncbi:SDR family NAD(P)-dependent oxidoreductase [Corallococcus caeni]|uniref:SDR family NAD(P)-dependent oxidoreductase n=1 Tax=Corallococcus caeni TaxID=3082388 RepID=UPI0030C716EC
MRSKSGVPGESIAIIGMACRFPGAKDVEAYWHNLVAGVSSIQPLPRERWVTKPSSQGQWSGLVEHVDSFDAAAFGISPAEADNMDPQQRLVLEEAWHCFEDAAVPLERLREKKTGVFIGTMSSDYLQELGMAGVTASRYASTGGFACIVANRVSYVFGFRGPSMAVEAACTSSLVALHEAKDALLRGECDYALVGGASLNLHPWKFDAFEQLRLFSPEGKSKTYDVDADGYAPGEGIGLVLLQRLSDARAEHNRVLALVRGTAVNHNGHGRGLTAPSMPALRDVTLAASEDAGFGLDTVSYMESHGTGTSLGDPIEFEGLTQAFRKHTQARNFCQLGSVKPNVGHLEPASGVASLIKILLMLRHRWIAPSIDVKTVNPLVDFDASPFQFARASAPWKSVREDVPLRAGMTCFGFGGVNAQVLVEAAPPDTAHREQAEQGPQVFTLSANSAVSLSHLVEAWSTFASGKDFDGQRLEDVCGTLARGRQSLPYRLGVVVEARDGVRRFLAQAPQAERHGPRSWLLRVGSGVGGQGAASRLVPGGALRRWVEEAQQAEALATPEGGFVAAHAYVAGLLATGFVPERITGHGDGVWPALVVSGVVRLTDALRVLRGELSPGAVELSRPSVPFVDPVGGGVWMRYALDADYLRDLVARAHGVGDTLVPWVESARLLIRKQHSFRKLAAEWAPALGGLHAGLTSLLDGTHPLKDVEDRHQRLLFAFVSAVLLRSLQQKWELDTALERLDPVLRELLELVSGEVIPRRELVELLAVEQPDFERIATLAHARQRRLRPGAVCPLLEGRSGRLHEAGDFAQWLGRAQALQQAPDAGEDFACLALGETTLARPAELTVLPAQARTLDDSFWDTALKLWLRGVDVRWDALYPDGAYAKVALPLYPFVRRRHWIEDSPLRAEREGRVSVNAAAPKSSVPAQGEVPAVSKSSPPPAQQVASAAPSLPAPRAPAIDARAFTRKVEAELLAAGTEILRVDAGALGAHDSLGDVGFDSLGLKDFAARIERQFKVDFNPSLFFSHPTIASIAEHLWEQYGEELARAQAPANVTPATAPASGAAPAEAPTAVAAPASAGAPASAAAPGPSTHAAPLAAAMVATEAPRTTATAPEARGLQRDMGTERGVAIIGMSGVFPGARDVDELWRSLRAGEHLISEAPTNRWDWKAWGEEDGTYLRWGGFAPGFDCFDASFFGASPREAELMDPQQRMLLQSTWKALEDAGLPPSKLSGRNVGVFMGVWSQDYHHRLSHHGLLHAQVETGNALTMLANRISYFFNFRGPSEVHNAACASSVVALHRAVQSLRSGECDIAIAGGVNVLALPEVTQNLAQVGILSRDGRCKTFDASANGYVRGEGSVVVVLKRLDQAEADADPIHAVVRGSRQNHGGRANSLTAPNPKAQAELILGSLDDAGFEPETVTYMEAHGTGTELGDPVEVEGLKAAFTQLARRRGRALKQANYCGIGSIKTNVGHLESAAGLAGVVKVLMAMRHGELPASLHVQKLNPLVRLEGSPFYIVHKTQPWTRLTDAEGRMIPRRAGVSSFGFGGANAHVALEEYVTARPQGVASSSGPWLFPLSARSADRLKDQAAQLIRFIEERLGIAPAGTGAVKGSAEDIVLSAASAVLGIAVDELRREEDWGATALGPAGVAELLGRVNEACDVELSSSVLSGSLSLKPLVQALEARGVGRAAAQAAQGPVAELPLADIAYTLQVGREEMEERLAIVAGSAAELLQRLRAFLSGRQDGETFVGSAKGAGRRNTLLSDDEDAQVMLRSWARKGKLPRLAELWVGGAGIDWAVLPQGEGCRRMPLPTYPFAQERYWLDAPKVARTYVPSPLAQAGMAPEAAPPRAGQVTPPAFERPSGHGPAPVFAPATVASPPAYAPVPPTSAFAPATMATPSGFAPTTMPAFAPPAVEAPRTASAPAYGKPGATAPASTASARPPAASSPRPVAAQPPVDLGRAVEGEIVRLVAEILGMPEDRIDREQQFAEYGINSIMGIGLVNSLNRTLGLSLRTTTLFDYPNVFRLRDFLLKTHAGAVEKAFAAKAPPPQAAPPEVALADRQVLEAHLPTPEPSPVASSDIAVIGLAGRFPGAPNARAFWKLLESGRSAITEVPASRWDWTRHYDPDPMKRDKTHCKWGGFLTDIDKFDARFFGITGREAELAEPQQRVFLEECWSALEDAGYATDEASRLRVGVFAGVNAGDYTLNLQQAGVQTEAQALAGNDCSVIPARLSYFLNLKGPSISLDTACSSSLTAIHLACRSLLAGDCEMAVAGGVFIAVTPSFYIKTSNAGMLSPRGQCRTFDDGADGFVPGEAAAAVVLKPLAAALRDRDHIYGVIKGTGVNQDGKTNGLTAPSALSQEELERSVYERAGVHPETISYVEAHGTGTRLGDPIEVQALTNAFRASTDRTRFCGLGSVKTNVGHTAAAAGVTGLIKLLLSLEHGSLPPSLGLERENEHIDFQSSPFYVVRQLQPWPRQEGRPRRAALSSFGFSGTNAHLVLEEAPVEARATGEVPDSHALIVLSGRTEEALLRRMRDLDGWLEAEGAVASLEDVSHTLLLGRRHFAVRAAFIVRNVAELREQLREALRQPTGARGTWFAEVANVTSRPPMDAAADEARWREARASGARFAEQLHALATAWLKGGSVEGTRLFAGRERRRVSLPTYPFARTRHWIGEPARDAHLLLGAVEAGGTLDTGLVFTRRLPEEAWVVAEHRVRGHAILPGVAYLEMAHEAARQALGPGQYTLRRVVWLQKLAVEGAGRDVRLTLRRGESGRLDFLVQSQGTEGDGWTTHAQGEVHTGSQPEVGAHVSLEELRARCERRLDAPELYQRYEGIGLRYGESFRSVREVRCGATEALSHLAVSGKQREEWNQWGLPPGMLDGAMQSVLGVVEQAPGTTVMPFAVEEVVLRRAVPTEAFAAIKQLGRLRYDVAILDAKGEVCVELNEVTLREWRDTKPQAAAKPEPSVKAEALLYAPRWEPAPAPVRAREWNAATQGARVVLVGHEGSAELEEAMAQAHAAEGVVRVRLSERTHRHGPGQWEWNRRDEAGAQEWLQEAGGLTRLYFLGAVDAKLTARVEDEAALEASQERGVVALFSLVKALSVHGWALKPLELRVVTVGAHRVVEGESPRPWGASVQGFAKAVANEYPALRVSYVDVGVEDIARSQWVEGVVGEEGDGKGADVALRQARRYVRRLLPVKRLHQGRVPLRQRGVYLLVGGGGGIGLAVGEWLARKYAARLVIVGRRAAEGDLAQKLKGLEAAGAEVEYVRADVTKPGEAARVVAQAKQRFGTVHGVFHLAVVIEDQLLERMTEGMLRTVLDSKVKASVAVHAALEGEPLECAVFFSSGQSFWGNVGASNYSAGCTFQDAYAAWLREVKNVPAFALNWGSWGSLGLVADEGLRRRLENQGILPMEAHEGMEGMEAVLAGAAPQMMIFKGTRPLLERLGVDFSRSVEVYAPATPGLEARALQEAPVWEQRAGGRLPGVEDAYAQVEAWGRAMLLGALKRLGAVVHAGEEWDAQTRARQVGVVEDHARLWQAMLGVLERGGYVERRGTFIRVTPRAETSPDARELEAWREHLLVTHPEFKPHLDLMWATLSRAHEVLRGELLPTEVLFPDSSSALVEAYYRGHPLADYFNRLVAIMCRWFVEERRRSGSQEPVRILEVGAGTGSTTAFVLEALKDVGAVEFVFTDVGLGFVNAARKQFGAAYPFATFQVLDVEKRPEAQGLVPGSFDLVMGTNVLHATKNIRRTLEQVKVLMKHHGWLAISELTDVPEYTTLTFGFLKGWWLFEDVADRLPDAPLLSIPGWSAALQDTGFRPLVACGQPGGLGHGLAQHVMLGVSDGCVGAPAMVSAQPPAPVVSAPPKPPAPPRPEAPPAPVPKPPAATPRVTGSSEEQRRQVEREIIQVAAVVLRIPEHELLPELPFAELGVDSILAVDLSDKLNRALSVALRSTDLFNYGSVRQLARHILELRGSAPSRAPVNGEDEMLSMLAALESGDVSIDEVDDFLERRHG